MNEENFSFFASSIFEEKIKKKLNNETLSILISLIRFIPSLSSITSTPSYTWQLLSPPKLTNEFHSILNSTRLLFSGMVGSPWKKKYIGWKPSRMMFCSTYEKKPTIDQVNCRGISFHKRMGEEQSRLRGVPRIAGCSLLSCKMTSIKLPKLRKCLVKWFIFA